MKVYNGTYVSGLVLAENHQSLAVVKISSPIEEADAANVAELLAAQVLYDPSAEPWTVTNMKEIPAELGEQIRRLTE